MGSPSPDGLTWTFHLKTGIHYAPPFEETTITAGEIARALERTGVLFENGFSTSFYYVNIDGFQAFEGRDGRFDLGCHRPERPEPGRAPPSARR